MEVVVFFKSFATYYTLLKIIIFSFTIETFSFFIDIFILQLFSRTYTETELNKEQKCNQVRESKEKNNWRKVLFLNIFLTVITVITLVMC